MLDRELEILFGLEIRVLNKYVRRNAKRFPQEFIFQLTNEDMNNWKSQVMIRNKEKRGLGTRDYAYSENNLDMLSII